MENQISHGFEFIKPLDVEEEYFVLSSEYVAMEDEYVLWKEEVNSCLHKKPMKETGIAEYFGGELFMAVEENCYGLEESYSI